MRSLRGRLKSRAGRKKSAEEGEKRGTTSREAGNIKERIGGKKLERKAGGAPPAGHVIVPTRTMIRR